MNSRDVIGANDIHLYVIYSLCERYQDICSERGDNFHEEQVMKWLLSRVREHE